MKIAIPTFGTRISPRFDHAPGCSLFDIDGDKITGSTQLSCEGWRDIERVSKLIDAKVDVLICGALPNFLMGILMNSGIRVIPWIAGNAGEALSLFLQGRLEQGMFVCPVRRRGPHCRRGTNICSNNSINKEERK
jgi:predicted Fe-Mo cluster-binding NifX family protein